MAQTISRRHSLLFAVGAALLTALRWRRVDAKPTFVAKTPPGDRFQTFSVGARSVYVREDLLKSGWYRDFRFHRKGREER